MSGYLSGTLIETVYFGGGTPSLLTASELNRLFDSVIQHHTPGQLKEVTLEANPDDLNKQFLLSLKHTPVTRLSIGVQSFRDADLQYMKRAHNAQQAEGAIKLAQDMGFENLTIDLIYGTPGLSDSHWKSNLQMVKTLGVPHFSAYALTVEERTALHHAIKHQVSKPVDPAQAAAQFIILSDVAQQMGYEHYEISNLALPGSYAVHNSNYWRGHPYLGIGPSAHSFDGHRERRWNVANNALYTKSLLTGDIQWFDKEQLSSLDNLNEYLMTSLRTQWGCDLAYIAHHWDDTTVALIAKEAQTYIDRGWMMQNDSMLTLSQEGRLYADRIASDLFVMENDFK